MLLEKGDLLLHFGGECITVHYSKSKKQILSLKLKAMVESDQIVIGRELKVLMRYSFR